MVERIERRRFVEQMLVTGRNTNAIAVLVAERFAVTPRSVWDDVRKIRKRWMRWEERAGRHRWNLAIRRFEWAIERAMAADDYAQVGRLTFQQAMLLGLPGRPMIDARRQTIVVGGQATAEYGLALQALAEKLESLTPEELRELLAAARRAAITS